MKITKSDGLLELPWYIDRGSPDLPFIDFVVIALIAAGGRYFDDFEEPVVSYSISFQ